MTKNLDIISAAVSLIIKAALLAARFSGRVRKRSLKRLAAMGNNKIKHQLGAHSDCKPTGTAEHLYLSLYGSQYSQ